MMNRTIHTNKNIVRVVKPKFQRGSIIFKISLKDGAWDTDISGFYFIKIGPVGPEIFPFLYPRKRGTF